MATEPPLPRQEGQPWWRCGVRVWCVVCGVEGVEGEGRREGGVGAWNGSGGGQE